LAELLAELEQVDGLRWIRLMYLYPMYVDDELIERIAASDKIVPYLDLPLQHISDPVLRRMQRRVSRQATEDLLARLRSRIDGLALRTTFITGFPGETEAQFEELLEFVEAQRFERLGVFTYSLEPDTPAARLDGHLDEVVKEARRERLMAAQQRIAFARNAAQVGRQVQVLIDRAVPGERDAWVGRTTADAPDVDAVVYVTGKKLRPGAFVLCEIVATSDYDLVGAAVGPPG
jgi:ribosomal protein S12 methylthiotransferase